MSMRAIAIARPGGPEVLIETQASIPAPKAGEVLIRHHAVGVNRPDVFQRQGLYPPPDNASPLPGLEVAGTVEAVASDVTRWQRGDRVCALVNGGGYAEYTTVAASQVLPMPQNLSFVEAAALPETCFTVWSNVFDRAALKPGERLLVHGGTSGIGTTAIQIARALGSVVYATAGSDEKCRVCEQLGAELAVNYRTQDFVDVLQPLGAGMDVILDMVGGDYVQRNMALAAMDGRLVSIAFLRGSKVALNLVPMLQKRLTLTGSTLRPQSPAQKAAIATALQHTVWPLIESGRVMPMIARTYELADAQRAHAFMESGELIGKVVLTIEGTEHG